MMRSNGSFRSTLATGMALVALAAACASSQSASERHGTIIDASRTVTHTTDNGVKVSLDAPRDSVWKALLGAYGDIGLLPDVADASTGAVGATRIPMRGVYRGMRTSMLFSCGTTATGVEQADAGQIVANVSSQLTGSGSGSTVSTLVDAYVIPDGGTSSNSLHCGSTGEIESRLHKALATRLGKPALGS
jgi:hypothetical protein